MSVKKTQENFLSVFVFEEAEEMKIWWNWGIQCGTCFARPCVVLQPQAAHTTGPPNRSNSPSRATETTIHNKWGRFTFISSFNLDIPRYKFTTVRLFNILPYISLYFEQTNRLAACVGSLCYNQDECAFCFLGFHLFAGSEHSQGPLAGPHACSTSRFSRSGFLRQGQDFTFLASWRMVEIEEV